MPHSIFKNSTFKYRQSHSNANQQVTATWAVRIILALSLISILSYTALTPRSGQQQDTITHLLNNSPIEPQNQIYLDPDRSRRIAPEQWTAHRQEDAKLVNQLVNIPTAIWFGDWQDSATIGFAVSNRLSSIKQHEVAVIVLYNIPHRDCGGHSHGGSTNAANYKDWVSRLSAALIPYKAIVILEPDALASLDCLAPDQQQERYQLLSFSVELFKNQGNKAVYIDAGHSAWQAPATIVKRLKLANIDQAKGFSLNISNFNATIDEVVYGQQISNLLNGKHLIIDISRNGEGPAPNYEWCNPPGRAIGSKPTLDTQIDKVDALLWVKVPGESDGECHQGDPPTGTWFPEYALDLMRNSLNY